MKLSVPTLGLIGAVSVSSASSAAVVGKLKKDTDWANHKLPNQLFDASKAESHKTAFQIKQLASKDDSKPLIPVAKTDCVNSFFPGQNISRPTNKLDFYLPSSSLENVLPWRGLDFSGSTNPIGCRTMKMSKLKNGEGFSYLSETAVQNDRYGFAFYLAATNTKSATAVNFEHWLFFFKKDDTGEWSVIKSGYWPRSVSSGSRQKRFSTKSPLGTEMTWNPPTTSSNQLTNLVNGTTTNSNDLWESNDLTDSGIWFVPSGWDSNLRPFLEIGSAERQALQCLACDDVADPVPFLTALNLTQRGKWESFRARCEYRSRLSDRYMLEGEKNLCFNKNPPHLEPQYTAVSASN